MNKAQFIEALATRLGSDKKAAGNALDAVLDEIYSVVVKGEKLALTGFGSFEKRDRGARVARNPATGASVRVKKTSVPAFRAGAEFKAVVSGAKKLPKPLAKKAAAAVKAAPARRSTAAGKQLCQQRRLGRQGHRAQGHRDARRPRARPPRPRQPGQGDRWQGGCYQGGPAKSAPAKSAATKAAPAKRPAAKATASGATKSAPASKATASKATPQGAAARRLRARRLRAGPLLARPLLARPLLARPLLARPLPARRRPLRPALASRPRRRPGALPPSAPADLLSRLAVPAADLLADPSDRDSLGLMDLQALSCG